MSIVSELNRQYYDATTTANRKFASRPLKGYLCSPYIHKQRISNSCVSFQSYHRSIKDHLSGDRLDSVDPGRLFDDWWGLGGVLLEENVALEEVRQPGTGLVGEELSCGHREDLVDFLQSELLGLADEAEDHAPSNQVESSVEAESTSCCHDALHTWESQTKNTGYTDVRKK